MPRPGNRPIRSPNSPVSARRTERQNEALQRRIKGQSFSDIADELGISVPTAHELVTKALRHTQEHNIEQAIELRALELLRLDGMHATLTGIIEKAERLAADDDLGASEAVILQTLDRLLRVIEKRAKLLGIDLATDAEAELRAPWVAVLANIQAKALPATSHSVAQPGPDLLPAPEPPRALPPARRPKEGPVAPPPASRPTPERVVPPEFGGRGRGRPGATP